MTTILAVQGDGWAVIGADSQWSTDDGRIGKSTQPKVVSIGKYLVAIAGYTRGANIIQHTFTPPAPPRTQGIKLNKFVVSQFIPAYKAVLESNDPALEARGLLKAHEESKAYKMAVVLAEFRDGPAHARFSMRHAYTTAGVHRTTLINWRHVHKLFDSLMEAVQEEMIDTLRAEAYRRAVVGIDEPLVHQGLKTGDTVKKYSDSLLQFTLMGYDAKFRAKDVNMNVSGSLDSNVNIEGLRDRLAQRLEQKAKAEGS